MERKLHPLFQQTNQKVQIQEKFDPTPVSYSQPSGNQNAITAAKHDLSEFVNETKLKTNRMNQKILNFESRIDNIAYEMRASLVKMSSRFSERIVADHKIEALIERQNTVVNSFEKRMNQLVKIVEESQTQLIRTQAALDEARREISKLKRL